MTPTFSLLYTSARHQQIPDVIRRWFKSANARWDIELCLTTDGGVWRGDWDGTLNKLCKELKIRRSQFKIAAVKLPPWNSVRGWNLAAEISTGKILMLISDDILSEQSWDTKILHALRDRDLRPHDEWVLHVDDASKKTVPQLIQPIISRKRLEKVGYFYHPLFTSMYPDTELEHKAIRDGVLVQALDICFEHLHPDFGKRERDKVDAAESGQTNYEEGHRVFEWLKAKDFPKPYPKVPQSHSDYAVYMQVIKDDFFLYEILERMVYEGVTKFFLSIPLFSWDGKKIHDEQVYGIQAVCRRIKDKYGCQFKMDLNWHYNERMSRLERETKVRNLALEIMRKEGWPFALIVDSDELWVPGTLAKVHALAKEGAQAVRTKMTTVAGIAPKAYPIDGSDRANVYIGPDVEFYHCRAPIAPMHEIEGVGVYHFSACRRTRELLVEKMKQSGHYGQKGYDFDKWLAERMDTLKIGDRNVHMTDEGWLWPQVRDWTDADRAVLPPAIKEFLRV